MNKKRVKEFAKITLMSIIACAISIAFQVWLFLTMGW